QDLREGRLAPSDTLQRMMEELGERRTEAAVRHYQAALLNDELRNPGRVNLREMYTRIAPHERTFLVEQITERKQDIARAQTPPKDTNERAISATPRESAVYREYLAEMGSAELRLLNEAVRERQRRAGYFVSDRAEHQLSITEARALLPRAEQLRIREQARDLAWDQLAEHTLPPSPETAQIRTSLRDTQERARLAHQALSDFKTEKGIAPDPRENLTDTSPRRLTTVDVRQLRSLEDYATRTREEFYRGFESLDALRRDPVPASETEEQKERPTVAPKPQTIERVIADPVERVTPVPAPLTNGRDFQSDGSATVRDDERREGHEHNANDWYVRTDQKWHFDSLPTPPEAPVDRGATHGGAPDISERDAAHER
ncbi:MAG: hypothetical protein ACKV2V_05395, partial [Blastocatellia bacterium]